MKKIFISLLLGIFMLSLTSAAEFDNVASYDEELKLVTITNQFGLGDTIGQAVLKSDLNVRVPRGYQQVAEFDIWAYNDYSDALKQFTFEDMKKGREKINRDYDLKMLEYEDIEVNDYKSECYTDYSNSTNETRVCDKMLIGTHIEKREVWTKITPADLMKNEVLTVGVFTDVQVGDYVDWIPMIFGVEIPEWATWTEDLNVGLISYYKLDEQDVTGTGTIFDSLFINNGTNNGGTNTTGKIETAYEFEYEETDGINLSNDTSFNPDELSISVWIKMDNLTGFPEGEIVSKFDPGLQYVIGANEDSGSVYPFWKVQTAGGSNLMQSPTAISSGTWYHLVATWDSSTGGILYVDNVSKDTDNTNSGNIIDLSANVVIGALRTSDYFNSFDGVIDEVGIWNRSLSFSEVTQLYNNGDGISYTDNFGVVPSVTLTSPVDNANLTSASVDFITTVTDDLQVDNVTLYLDGIANETNSSGFNGTYTFSKTVSEGVHNWSILAYNNESNSNQSETRTFNYTQPTISIDLLSPADVSTHDTSIVNMSCEAYKDIGVTQLNLTIDGVVNISITNSSIAENLTISQNVTFGEGNYTWGCSAVNTETSAVSANRTFEVLYSSPIINLFTPENDTTILVGNLTFIFNASDENGIENVTLYIDGVLNETNSSGFEGNYSFFRYLADGYYNWNVEAISTLGKSTNSSTRTFILHTEVPVVNITAPSGIIDYILLGDNVTLVYNISETGENSSHFDECLYLYNGTNNTLNCSETELNFTYIEGQNNITVFAEDEFSFIANATSYWSYNITEVSQTYPASSLESATETYTANITYDNDTFLVVTGAVTINGTSHSGTTSTSGEDAYLSAEVTMPNVGGKTNFTAYWTVSLTDSTGTSEYNLSSNNVTVDLINMSLCGAPYDTPFWNFTILNESNGAEINSTFDVTFTVRKTGSTADNYFSFSDDTEVNSEFDFCMYPVTESYTVDTTIKLTKSGFVDRFYNYEDVVLTNSTREDNLYMLASEDSTSYIVHVVYADSSDVTEAEVQVQRYYEGSGTWVTTEIITTNDVGEAVGHLLSEDADYKFLVYQDGVSLHNSSSTKITCSVTPCTVTLIISIIVLSGIETTEDLDSTLTYSDTTDIFTYTYSDSSGDFSTARLYVYKSTPTNATILSICNVSKTSSSGVLTCDITGQINGTYIASGYITRDGDEEFLDKRIEAIIGTNIYNAMGNDGVLWAFFIFIGIAMLGIARPSLAIVFGTAGLISLALVEIINIGALSIVAVSAIAIILLMRVGRE